MNIHGCEHTCCRLQKLNVTVNIHGCEHTCCRLQKLNVTVNIHGCEHTCCRLQKLNVTVNIHGSEHNLDVTKHGLGVSRMKRRNRFVITRVKQKSQPKTPQHNVTQKDQNTNSTVTYCSVWTLHLNNIQIILPTTKTRTDAVGYIFWFRNLTFSDQNLLTGGLLLGFEQHASCPRSPQYKFWQIPTSNLGLMNKE